MLSKFLRTAPVLRCELNRSLFLKKTNILQPVQQIQVKKFTNGLIPKSQYDLEAPIKLTLGHVVIYNWELIPIIAIVTFALSMMFGAMIWAYNNTVDFSKNHQKTISRTMDLCHPTVHKFVTINQEYHPWPEMQGVLDDMRNEEVRAMNRAKMGC